MTTPTATAPTAAPTAATVTALERISVAAPYFAFDDIERRADGSVDATVPPAPPTLPERGAIAADQVARHLAILGSCAAALSENDGARHHYLATRAVYERVAAAPEVPTTERLRAVAHASRLDKRTARADMELRTESGDLLNRLSVHYAVMKPRMFERLNPPTSPGDPTTDQGLRVVEPGHVLRACGSIDERMCAGHFPDRPTAPVALVMGRLVATAAAAMSSRLGTQVDYRVEGGTVEATGLAVAGQDLVLEARHLDRDGDRHTLRGTATADGRPIGTVDVELTALSH